MRTGRPAPFCHVGTPTVRGYAANAATFRALLDMLDDDADVVLCQLDNTDGVSHQFGPDSPEAKAAYTEADGLVGELIDRLRGGSRWQETVLAVISDHGQITADLSAPPIDIPGALARAGIEAEVIEEGSSALIRAQETGSAASRGQHRRWCRGRAPIRIGCALCACTTGSRLCDAQTADARDSWLPGNN